MSEMPLGIRLLQAVRKEPDWSLMSPAALEALREAENRKRSSRLVRVISGFPRRGATITWGEAGHVRVRIYRPEGDRLPVIVHVHGGGFVGTAVQSDWINSHLAVRLPALVVSVEHRLLRPGTPMAAMVDDGWNVLTDLVHTADPDRVAVFGESAGAVVAATSALRARDAGLALRAQVLVNPCVDMTATAFDYGSMSAYANSPTLTVPQMEFFVGLAVPEGADARAVSPLYADDLGDLAPALVVVPVADPLADQGRAYAERLRKAGTAVRLTEHAGAPHAFLSMPGVVPQAKAARTEITDFLRETLC